MEIKDLVGLEKPATELINRVSNAVGGIAKPWQMKRVAKAEVEIKKLHAVADLEITEQRQRAMKRLILEEEKNQENIESVTAKAIPHLAQDSKPQELDEDFVRYLFDKAKMVSNEDMQEVWGRILAGEANRPGAFSRRTMEIVSQMSPYDAKLFLKFCRSVWLIGGPCPVMTMDQNSHETNPSDLAFGELNHLAAVGVITHHAGAPYIRTGFKKRATIKYFDCLVELEFANDEKNTLVVGPALLTRTGLELITIVADVKESKQSFEWALESMVEQGVSVALPIAAKDKYPTDD